MASGANVDPEGNTNESREWMMTKMDGWAPAARLDYYAKVSPGGAAQWPVLVGKLRRLWLDTPTRDELSLDLLKKIQQPALLITGDRDGTTHEHTLAMFRALPHGQLFVVPGTGHDTFARRSEWMNAVILSFLDSEIKAAPR